MHHDTQTNDHFCRADERCRAYDRTAKHPAHVTGGNTLCETDLDAYSRDISSLIYDYVDLEQMQLPRLSQAIDSQPRGKAGPPMPMAGEPEALQAEIHYVLTAWETELRAADRLADVEPRRQHGANIQRALTIILPRMRMLSRLAPVTCYPRGCEDDLADVAGWQAIQQLAQLHHRARAMLGRTRRTFWIPGDCWTCTGRGNDSQDGPLWRAEPRWANDEQPVWCNRCNEHRPYADYETYMLKLVWPGSPEPHGVAA